jgi:hypothetical protein
VRYTFSSIPMKIVVDCFSKSDTILFMSNNTHTYTTTVTETLPPGRLLKAGEIRQRGDLFLPDCRKSEPCVKGYFGSKILDNIVYKRWYRPDPVKPPVAKQRHDGLKCQEGYRFLNADEVVKKGDQFEFVGEIKDGKEDWWNVSTNIGQIAGESLCDDTVYRRKLEKKPRVRKTGYRFLKEGEIVKKDDDYNWGSITSPNWEKVMPAIYGEKGGYAVTKIAADCKFYRRRLR